MDYIVKVPISVAGNEFKPGDKVTEGHAPDFIADWLKQGLVVEAPSARFAVVKDDK